MGNHKICKHVAQTQESISARTKECEEYKKEGTRWVAPRLCVSCGHVGCCDSSPEKHVTPHLVSTGHPVMVALSHEAWRWCYIHRTCG
ncbi:MAG: UBP-type zinc finger domain-containing protein [Thermoproteota archaeon]|nr:UBP-type zinc finger domain-containing protein [Thermoproteota archaeon]MDQ5843561.1 UBP-type zinc finger domain-containing protein [Thermoproteota archaeon]